MAWLTFLAQSPQFASPLSPSTLCTGTVGRRSVTQQGAGTGFVLDENGLIATNAHVIAGASQISVTMASGMTLPATVVGSDSRADLAVLHIQGDGPRPLKTGNSSGLRVGQTVIATDNALELGPALLQASVSSPRLIARSPRATAAPSTTCCRQTLR